MKAIETMATVNTACGLVLDEALPLSASTRVRVLVLVPDEISGANGRAGENGRENSRGTNPEVGISPLGRELRRLREQIVASGVELLDEEGLEREMAERSGEGRYDNL